jgi:hypothetical protein
MSTVKQLQWATSIRTAALTLGILLRVALPQPVHAQDQRPEIFVVGTVHEPTKTFTEDSLVALLYRVQPDLILLEFDPSFFDSNGVLLERFRRLTLESRAARAYADTNPVALRPFDIEGRNKFYEDNEYFARETQLNQEISRLHANGQLVPLAKAAFDSLLIFAARRDACGAATLAVMNSADCDSAVERKQHYAFEGFARIIALTPALQSFAEFWKLADDFWTRRNVAMVSNIMRYTSELKAQRVVVLTGFEHRYLLRRELAARAPALLVR